MTRKDALTAMKARKVPAKDAIRALMYAEATGLATGKGYAVTYTKGAGYAIQGR